MKGSLTRMGVLAVPLLLLSPAVLLADGVPEDEAAVDAVVAEAPEAPEVEATEAEVGEADVDADVEAAEADAVIEEEAVDARAEVLEDLAEDASAAETAAADEAMAEEPPPATAPRPGEAGPVRPPSWLWTRGAVAVSGWPAGFIVDTKTEARTALHRSKSMVFQDTYAGAGLRFAITPAFVDVGPRISLAPIDVFDLEVQGGWVGLWPSSSGLLPYPDLAASKLDYDRGDRQDLEATKSRAGQYWYVTASPTLKLKVGPIIALDSWSFTWSKIVPHPDETASLFYEPYRDLILQRDDLIVEQQAALLYEVLPGKGGPLLWVGATFQDRIVTGSGDRTMALGALAIYKPVDDPKWPRIVVLGLPYLKYEERIGQASVAVLLAWSHDFGLGWQTEVKHAATALRTISGRR